MESALIDFLDLRPATKGELRTAAHSPPQGAGSALISRARSPAPSSRLPASRSPRGQTRPDTGAESGHPPGWSVTSVTPPSPTAGKIASGAIVDSITLKSRVTIQKRRAAGAHEFKPAGAGRECAKEQHDETFVVQIVEQQVVDAIHNAGQGVARRYRGTNQCARLAGQQRCRQAMTRDVGDDEPRTVRREDRSSRRNHPPSRRRPASTPRCHSQGCAGRTPATATAGYSLPVAGRARDAASRGTG